MKTFYSEDLLHCNFKGQKFIWQITIVWKFLFQVIQNQLNIPDKVIFRLRWSIIEHPCNQRTDLWVLSNRSSLNIVMQSWNCWPMFTYCPIFIPWLKHKGKKVQDPVYITSNWINVLFNTPANPLIPGRWVSWESTFSSWWDNRVSRFLRQPTLIIALFDFG